MYWEYKICAVRLSRKEDYCFDEMFDCADRTYDPETDTTLLKFPYTTSERMALAHEPEDGLSYQGFSIVDETEDSLTVSGDLTDGVVRMGQPFTSSCTLSEFFVSQDGKTGSMQGRLQLRSLTFSFTTTGDFRVLGNFVSNLEEEA